MTQATIAVEAKCSAVSVGRQVAVIIVVIVSIIEVKRLWQRWEIDFGEF